MAENIIEREELYIDDRPIKWGRPKPCPQKAIIHFIRIGQLEVARQMVEYNDMLASGQIVGGRKTAKAAN